MADRWLYRHAGSVKGPVSDEQLKQLAAAGQLLVTDLVWPDGGDPRRAVEAQAVLNFAALPRPMEATGAWLGKVAQALATPAGSTGPTPDWMSDVKPPPASAASPAPSAPVPPQAPPVPPVRPSAATAPPSGTTIPLAQPVPPASAGPASRAVLYPPRLLVSGTSSRGRVRDRNEDRYQTLQWSWNDADGTHEVALLVVADGMGGYQAGDEASALAVRTVMSQLGPVIGAATSGRRPDGAALGTALDQALREANRVVFQQAASEARCKGMGATAAVVVIWDGRAYFGHVGDCRIYLHRGSELKQLTEDQTLVARMVALGQLKPEEAVQHEARNEVTQAIGGRATIEPSRGSQELLRGDYLLVACDGLAAHVEKPTIQQVLNRPTVPALHQASQLVNMADEGGGSDNCTVVVAHFA